MEKNLEMKYGITSKRNINNKRDTAKNTNNSLRSLHTNITYKQKTMREYRNNGAIGALLDEYEKALIELQSVITDLTNEDLITIVDSETKDSDCKSIQTILTHVVRAGYCYVIEIRNSLGEQVDFVERKTFDTAEQYKIELRKMFRYNEELFKDYPNLNIEQLDPKKKIVVKWGQSYDIEQLLEHAIVHILRHRRQIERFIIKLQST